MIFIAEEMSKSPSLVWHATHSLAKRDLCCSYH